MATQLKTEPYETRSERLVVLVSPTEKRAIEARARESKATLSDFVREAAQHYDGPTEEQAALLRDLLDQIDKTDRRIDARLAEIDAMNAKAAAFDEDAYKAELNARWTNADGSTNWDVMLADFERRRRGG